MTGPLLIRADASVEIGTGHVMRCLALAQAWQDTGGQVTFCCAKLPAALHQRLEAEGMSVNLVDVDPGSSSDGQATIAASIMIGAAWVVVDGYVFGAEYQKQIKEAGLRLLFVDDYGHCEHYAANIILNQNLYASDSLYVNREIHAELLLGLKYALLRREFWPFIGWSRDITPQIDNILVTMGGSDPNDITQTVLQGLNDITGRRFTIIVVVGANYQYVDGLNQFVDRMKHNVHVDQDVRDMSQRITWADMAISAGGSTMWEILFLQLPTVIVAIADNQQPIAEACHKRQVAISIGSDKNSVRNQIPRALRQIADPQVRLEMQRLSRNLIDGHGASRVVEFLRRFEAR